MPKLEGYTTIVVKELLRSWLQELASSKGYRSINQLLEAWIGVNPINIREKSGARNEPETRSFPKRQFKRVVGRSVSKPKRVQVAP